MMDVYISRFFYGYDDTCFSVMINFGATSNIISSEIVQHLSDFLAKIINEFIKDIDRHIIASKLREIDFTLVADYIPLTQDSTKVLLENKISYFPIIFGLP